MWLSKTLSSAAALRSYLSPVYSFLLLLTYLFSSFRIYIWVATSRSDSVVHQHAHFFSRICPFCPKKLPFCSQISPPVFEDSFGSAFLGDTTEDRLSPVSFHSAQPNSSLRQGMDSSLISRSFDDGGASTSGENASRRKVLERKRPPRLHLKQDFPGFNEFANDANQKSQDVSFQGDCYGVWSRKGKRLVMEDTFVATSSVNGDPSQAFFGVFDGHGGTKAAEFAAGRLMPNILQSISNKKEEKVEEAVKSAYLLTDKEFCQEGVSSGASCVTALITGGHILVANAGDCRAVLSRNGDAVPLTRDHLANREDEQRRIVNLGGYVDLHAGCWRVQGTLAVSRSIGDAYLKKWVCAEPDVSILRITPEFEFIILASDGLWHMVKNQEAVDCARHFLKAEDARSSQLRDEKENKSSGALDACRKLVETAIARGCLDDITVVVIKLNHFRQAGDNGFTRKF